MAVTKELGARGYDGPVNASLTSAVATPREFDHRLAQMEEIHQMTRDVYYALSRVDARITGSIQQEDNVEPDYEPADFVFAQMSYKLDKITNRLREILEITARLERL